MSLPLLTELAPRVLPPGTFWIRDAMNAGSVGCGSWQRPVNGPRVEEAEKAEARLWRVLEAMGGPGICSTHQGNLWKLEQGLSHCSLEWVMEGQEWQLGKQERTAEVQGSQRGGRGDGRVLSAGDRTRR